MYRVAASSSTTSSFTSGAGRAARSATSRTHSASVLPARLAASSTSRTSSDVIRVPTVLVRKLALGSGLEEASARGAAAGKEGLMGNNPG